MRGEEMCNPIRLARRWAAAACVALLCLAAAPTRAGLVATVPTFSAAAGSSGSFDLVLSDNDSAASQAIHLAGFDLTLQVTGPTGVTFTAAGINTALPYVFVTSGTTQGGGPLSFDTFPNTTFTASDSEFAAPGFRAVSPGTVFGLVHVSYSVAPSAALGDRPLTITAADGSDESANAVALTPANGVLTVTAAPEPGSLALLGAGLLGLLRRRR